MKHRSSLRSRILVTFLITWFILIVILSGVAVYTQVQAAQSNGVQSALSGLTLAEASIDQTIRKIDLIGIRLTQSDTIRHLTDATFSQESDESRRLLPLQTRNLLYNENFFLQEGHAISLLILCGDGRVYTNLNGSTTLTGDVATTNLAKQLSNYFEGDSLFSFDIVPEEVTYLPANTLVYHRRFASVNDPEYLSELFIFAKNTDFVTRVKKDSNSAQYGLIDNDGRILISDCSEWFGANVYDLFHIPTTSFADMTGYTVSKGNNLLVYYSSGNTRYSAFCRLSRSEFLASANGIVLLILLVAIVSMIIFFIFSVYLSRYLTLPLRKLGDKMNLTAGGDMSARFSPQYNDEIGLIGQQFDTMVVRLGETMDRLQLTEREKRHAELRALEMQINPHFMYNTLSSIIWLANEEKNNEVIDITKRLSCYLRLSLSEGREFITVRDEIEHVNSYMSIQSYRYADILTYVAEIDPQTESLYMPKLLIQPLVENALYHGVKERSVPGGIIRVRTYLEDGCVCIDVSDNGDADAERCSVLNAAMQNNESLGIGTDTVNNRMKLWFGDEYALRFSKQGEWTVASLRIPVREEGDRFESADRR